MPVLFKWRGDCDVTQTSILPPPQIHTDITVAVSHFTVHNVMFFLLAGDRFNDNTQMKQPSVTTAFNGSRLHRRFIYNNSPRGAVPLGPLHIYGIL